MRAVSCVCSGPVPVRGGMEYKRGEVANLLDELG